MFDLIGKTIGPYRVVEQVGVGGMATVYKAYQPSMDRYVAIKILPHYLSQDPEFVKRFQREARAIAKLEHAHILPVHDYGEYEGIAYIVMRYVEAGTLKDRMAQGQLPLDEIGRLIEQIGGALDYAHRLGVIHRDIKPGNVLLDTQGDTYLSDFGLARMMEATQQLTASGVGLGTPAYMSPEQGQGVKVDHRSDIYSLGVILYEMVTGHVPFEAETPMAVVIKHITDPLPLPRTVKPDVPEPIERVILRALAKDPAHRYQTAGEFVQALAVAVRNVSVPEAARPVVAEAAPARREDVSLVTRVQQVWEKPRGKVALAGGGVIALILLGALLSRIPGNIAIIGPRVTETAAAIAQATTTTAPTQATTATSASPTVTTISPTSSAVITPAAVAALSWEQVHNGAAFLRADVSAL
ncbi:MAG: Protein kinase protein, partial [Anaerolineales bacterium]|nr:Protein kinase protein [Anaerolineales bacterium]